MRKLGYVPALDGIRGIAIALVVSSHLTGWPFGGGYGVDLFFVLSGFLITTLLLEEYRQVGQLGLRAFYERRARRLVPALAVVIAVYSLVSAAEDKSFVTAIAVYGLYIGNIWQAFIRHGFGQTGLDHLWSLAEEEQFYLIWPWILLALLRARRPLRWLLPLLLVLVGWRLGLIVAHANPHRLAKSPDTHSEGLVLGAVIAFWRPAVNEKLAKASFAAIAAFAILGAPLGAFSLFFVEAGAAGLVAAALSPTALARGLAWPPLVWLGKISYSLYLWHFVILWAFAGRQPGLELLLSISCAWASYRWVEVPFRRRRPSQQAAIRPVRLAAVRPVQQAD